MERPKIRSAGARTARAAAYGLSLPIRLVRATAAFVGGTSTLLTETLLPQSVRGSSTYLITFGLLQSFLIERVAGIRTAGPAALKERYLMRKTLGNVLELAGLVTVRFSPLWVFAIAADATGGGRVFLERLVEHLKQNRVLPQDAHPRELVDVLQAVQEASRASVTAVDQPPLTRAELESMVSEMRAHYTRVFSDTGALLRHMESTWQGVVDLSQRERVPMEKVLGVLALEAVAIARKSAGTVSAVGGASWSLLDEAVLSSYRVTLERMWREGMAEYVTKHYRPFLNAALQHFEPGRLTRLEEWLGMKGDPAIDRHRPRT